MALALLKDADHFTFANNVNATISEYSVAWMKRFLDNDTRYDQFLCRLRATRTSRPSRTLVRCSNTERVRRRRWRPPRGVAATDARVPVRAL